MGLDMYLYIRKQTCLAGAEKDLYKGFYDPELRIFEDSAREKGSYLSKSTDFEVGYWRKANAIHSWIVNNCADGVDNCEPIYISMERLEELNSLCNKVLEDPSKAEELLPTRDGFFFGGTDYDEWYLKQIQYTADLLTTVIMWMKHEKKDDEHSFYDVIYQASW